MDNGKVEKTIAVNGINIPMSQIKGIECVFSTYSANKLLKSDMLIVKENVHFKDGRVEPNIRLIRDKKWPFYVTKEGFRNHNDKKEWEDINRLQRFNSTRVELTKTISRVMGGMELPLRTMANSPYLYGADILPTALIKNWYQKTWSNVKTAENAVASLDTETSMIDGRIIMANVCFKNKAYTSVVRSFTKNDPHFIEKCKQKALELMGDEIREKQLEWEIEIVETPGEATMRAIMTLHKWRPDYVSIWNMNFDIPKMVDALVRDGYDPAQVFSDPSVPNDFKFFKYMEGSATRKNQAGVVTSLHPAERWHVCTCPASFYFVDSMCLYKRIRTAAGNENSYALDYILNKQKCGSKLKMEELKHLEEDGDLWHYEMQDKHPVFYTVYNLRDDTALLDLDAKTGDIASAFNTLAGISDYSNYNKNPRRIVDDLHFFVMDRGKIIATTPDDISKDPLNVYVLGMNQWVVTLPAYMIDNGMNLFEDLENVKSMIYHSLADLDLESTYPNAQLVLNISKETTLFETGLIRDFTESQRRELGLLLTSGNTAALEIGIKFFGLPSPAQLIAQYDKDHAIDKAA